MTAIRPMTFQATRKIESDTSLQEEQQGKDENRQKVLENLVKQLPAEATAVYLMGLDAFAAKPLGLTIAMAAGAIILIVVRMGLKATRAIIGTCLVSYILWVYAMGDGPVQVLLNVFHVPDFPGTATFLIFFWTTLVTVLASNGWLK